MSVNESIRRQENIQRVLEIQKSFGGNVKFATGKIHAQAPEAIPPLAAEAPQRAQMQ